MGACQLCVCNGPARGGGESRVGGVEGVGLGRMSDPQVKKALKDLALPPKPSATKACIVLADKVLTHSRILSICSEKHSLSQPFFRDGGRWLAVLPP